MSIISDKIFSHKFNEKEKILKAHKFLKDQKYDLAIKALQDVIYHAKMIKEFELIKKKLKK